MDVEPHAPEIVAEDVVVVELAFRRNGAQVGHGQVARLLAVQLVKITRGLPTRIQVNSNHLNTEHLNTGTIGVRYSNGIVTYLGGPFKYQTFWTIKRLCSVEFSDHHLNTRPFDNQTKNLPFECQTSPVFERLLY